MGAEALKRSENRERHQSPVGASESRTYELPIRVPRLAFWRASNIAQHRERPVTKHHAACDVPFLTVLALIACACGDARSSAADGDAMAGEELVVLVRSDDEAVPLEGASVAIEQDGVISAHETDEEGRATFLFDPGGSPVTVSASYPEHQAQTRVAVEVDELREAQSEQGSLPLHLRLSQPAMVSVSGSIRRRDPNAALAVETNTDGAADLPEARFANEFSVLARADRPFIVTAYEQIASASISPTEGASWPIRSWQTLRHKGGSLIIGVRGEEFRNHELGKHRFTILRPTTPTSMASDDAFPFVSAYVWDAAEPYNELAAAETSSVAPWAGQERYGLSVTGRADLMDSESLNVRAVIYDALGRYTTITSRGTGINAGFRPIPSASRGRHLAAHV